MMPTAVHGVMTLPHAVAASIATAEAVRRDETAELAQRVRAAQQMEEAYAYAKELLDGLAATRLLARAVLN